ncbi:MAG TPA: hydrogenase maturation protease [Chitinophagaceae bacterium]|nr:hydrogenase maturation protease [Chitinophagaceae bacterium]
MKNVKTDPAGTGSGMLVIGIGNSGRGDDGLGWEFVERISSLGFDFLDYEFKYQLQVEDAALISKYDLVIFVDASHEKLTGGYQMRRCMSANHSFISTHAQAPEAILYLCNQLYTRFPNAYTLAISGKEWDLQTSLSREAERNLESAVSFFTEQFLPTIQPKMVFSY